MVRILFFLLATNTWAGELYFLNENLRTERIATTEIDRLLSRAVLESKRAGSLASLLINDPYSSGETNGTLLMREEPLLYQQYNVFSLGDIADNAGFLQVAFRRWFDFEVSPGQKLDPMFEAPAWMVHEQRAILLALLATLGQVTGASELMADSERQRGYRVYAPAVSRLIASLVALDGQSGSPARAEFLFLTNRLWAFALMAQTLSVLTPQDPYFDGFYELTKQMTQELVVSFESHYRQKRKVRTALERVREFLLNEVRGKARPAVNAFDKARYELDDQRQFQTIKRWLRKCQSLFPTS